MQFGHGKRAKFFHEQLKAMLFIYVWIYENGAKELKSRPKGAFYFSPETPKISKVDDIKIKRKVSLFFPSSTRLSPFHCPLTWLEEGDESEIKVQLKSRSKGAFFFARNLKNLQLTI